MDTSKSFTGNPDVSHLEANDPRLEDFAAIDLDVAAIAGWANNPDPAIRRNRIQFMDTLPLLTPMLAFQPDDPFSEDVIGWIDRGGPLIDNISGLFGDVRKSTVRFLVGKPFALISKHWIGNELDAATGATRKTVGDRSRDCVAECPDEVRYVAPPSVSVREERQLRSRCRQG
ncbi:MAG: hypothetical protein AUK53_06695 [Betaproteobacteria bacterium CG2_30_59_46]|nr:MAG: hypothetical protein AUK53_06695 [Betaproteobacteria bacterium CG2_30_59_46]PIQ13111.1 MAG: hypothetical protein COW70_06430 [Hydrogenophilales bacterium CG18_big_fil_WC_8_21_14_2_50_58_12]